MRSVRWFDADGDPPHVLYAKQVIRATERAMEHAAMAAHEDLKHGLNTLATITSIAPFIGVFGTVWAIGFDTFRGVGSTDLRAWQSWPRDSRGHASHRHWASSWDYNRFGATATFRFGSTSLTAK